MPSQNTQWYKDARLIQYLDDMRQKNLKFMSRCYFCEALSTDIKAIKEKLYPVCESHQEKSGE